MEPKYLKHTGNGRIFAWTPILAGRSDMLPYEGEMPSQKLKQPVQAAEVVPDIPEMNTEGTDPNKIFLILDAIDGLGSDGFTKRGLPDATKLSQILGISISAEERDEAWAIKNKGDGATT